MVYKTDLPKSFTLGLVTLLLLVTFAGHRTTLAHPSAPVEKTLTIAEARSLPLGTVVTIAGTITQPIVNDLPFGFIIFINDGSGEVHAFVCASTGIDVSGLSPGQTIELTGFSGQFADSFEVDPRTQEDIRVVP